jgi:hypothetical protein
MKTLADFGLTPDIIGRFLVNATPPPRETTLAKARSARENGKLGGRPKKSKRIERLRIKHYALGLNSRGTRFKKKSHPSLSGLTGKAYRHAYYLLTGDNGRRSAALL